MKTKLYVVVLIVSLCTLPENAFGLEPRQSSGAPDGKGVELSSLTKTIVTLLRGREHETISLGSYRISVEDLFGDDVAAAFDCDAAVQDYLEESGGGANYGMLSSVMEDAISGNFSNTGNDVIVHVEADGDIDTMHFDIYIECNRTVSIPILLEASDDSFSISFTTSCPLRYVAEIELFIDSRLVNSENYEKGVSLRIDSLLFELGIEADDKYRSDHVEDTEEGVGQYVQGQIGTIVLTLKNQESPASMDLCNIHSFSNWYLINEDPEYNSGSEEERDLVTYEQLKKGEYRWEELAASNFETRLRLGTPNMSGGAVSDDTESMEFYYSIDNLRDKNAYEQFHITGNGAREDSVTIKKSLYEMSL